MQPPFLCILWAPKDKLGVKGSFVPCLSNGVKRKSGKAHKLPNFGKG